MALGLNVYLNVVLLMEIGFFCGCEATIYWWLETLDSGERGVV